MLQQKVSELIWKSIFLIFSNTVRTALSESFKNIDFQIFFTFSKTVLIFFVVACHITLNLYVEDRSLVLSISLAYLNFNVLLNSNEPPHLNFGTF